jgi:hypothetical protein
MPESIDWRKSSFSGSGEGADCLELAAVAGTIRLRESDAPEVVVSATPEGLRAFICGIKAGELDDLLP